MYYLVSVLFFGYDAHYHKCENQLTKIHIIFKTKNNLKEKSTIP